MIPWLDANRPEQEFPPLDRAMISPNGLLCAGGCLSVERLLSAYRAGVFPWYSEGEPVMWWSPDPRMIIEPGEVRVSRRLERTLTSGRYRSSIDRAFNEVIQACAQPRTGQPGTWISEAMIGAYASMHAEGHAHSLEVWDDGDRLVGGIYGIAIGRAFFGESMFHTVRDASKLALVWLCRLLQRHDFGLLDCQVESAHLVRMGARNIPRIEFRNRIDSLCAKSARDCDWHSLS